MAFDKNTIKVGNSTISELNFPVGSTPTDIKEVYETGPYSNTVGAPILVWKKTGPYFTCKLGFDYYTSSPNDSSAGFVISSAATYINDSNAGGAVAVGENAITNETFTLSPNASGYSGTPTFAGFIVNRDSNGFYYFFVQGKVQNSGWNSLKVGPMRQVTGTGFGTQGLLTLNRSDANFSYSSTRNITRWEWNVGTTSGLYVWGFTGDTNDKFSIHFT